MIQKELFGKRRISFSQRLFWSVFTIFMLFIACFFVFQYQREKAFAEDKLNNVLSNYNYQLYRYTHDKENISEVVRQFISDIPQKDLRVTVIDPSGNVLFDNNQQEELSNHNNRQEVIRARSFGQGFTIRESDTTGKRYFYSATNIGDYIYRSALPFDPALKELLKIDTGFIYFLAIMGVLFLFVISNFTRSISKTVSRLKEFALHAYNGQMPDTEYAFPDDELGDISKHIVTLYKRQKSSAKALSMEREKLIKHFQYAKEGFSMFDPDGKELISNILFIQFFNILSDTRIHQAEEALDLKETENIKTFLKKNISNKNRKKNVLRESVIIDKNGKIFLIECLLFLDNSYEISIHDISLLEQESRMKRQLTQNIAHELKTPVSSIQGYLETIISNPGLSPEKRDAFIERCYAQSSRLTHLLRDISVLNRLDEAAEMFDLNEVNLVKMISEIEREASKRMEEKNITSELILPGNPIIFGNHSLLYSIFQNLYDNAIAYAGEGIKIIVNCYKEDPDYYYFSFSDTGNGISEEHINRIFERFYRLDKGRSRKAGGTGLGLSIVKHGVNFHKGQISAKSTPGSGLTFYFTLKKKV